MKVTTRRVRRVRRMGKNLGVVFPVILRLGFLESIDKSIGTQAGCASLQ